MSREINELQRKKLDELEKGKLKMVTVYSIEMGMRKVSTTDKDAAFKLWQLLSDSFIETQELGSSYEPPHFRYLKPIKVKLEGEQMEVWDTYEDAQRAKNAFDALANKSKEE